MTSYSFLIESLALVGFVLTCGIVSIVGGAWIASAGKAVIDRVRGVR